jgi:hypothetical protein
MERKLYRVRTAFSSLLGEEDESSFQSVKTTQ